MKIFDGIKRITVSPLDMRIILSNDNLILECERTIRVPLANSVVSQQSEVKHSIVVHDHAIGLRIIVNRKRFFFVFVIFSMIV